MICLVARKIHPETPERGQSNQSKPILGWTILTHQAVPTDGDCKKDNHSPLKPVETLEMVQDHPHPPIHFAAIRAAAKSSTPAINWSRLRRKYRAIYNRLSDQIRKHTLRIRTIPDIRDVSIRFLEGRATWEATTAWLSY